VSPIRENVDFRFWEVTGIPQVRQMGSEGRLRVCDIKVG